jgi:hypothetical protein
MTKSARKTNITASIFFCLIANYVCFAQAVEFEGFEFPRAITIENETLVLNGLAIRKATIFNIRVLVAALYLPEVSSDSEAILSSSGSKQLQIRFLKNLSAKTIVNTWAEQMMKNCTKDCDLIMQKSKELEGLLTDIDDQDLLKITFSKTHVTVAGSKQKSGMIEGVEFAKAFFRIWIGSNPLNEDLKKSLLTLPTK